MHKSQKYNTTTDPIAILADPTRATITRNEAALVLGVGLSTVIKATQGDELMPGVPIIRVRDRVLISKLPLIDKLGLRDVLGAGTNGV